MGRATSHISFGDLVETMRVNVFISMRLSLVCYAPLNNEKKNTYLYARVKE